MITRHANPRKQGDAGMGMAIAYFATRGYTVCLPLTDSQPYDLVVDYDGLKRVSVKTTTRKSPEGNYIVGLRTQGGNKTTTVVKKFDSSTCELLYVATEGGTEYLIPTCDISVESTITLGSKYAKYASVV